MIPDADVVIAGGGPGGLATAAAAASKGVTVAVFERNSEIGSPTRTSGGSFIQDMVAFGIPPHLYHPVHTCRFLSPNRAAEFSHASPVACVIDVRGVYQHLAERAVAAGARIFPATTVTGPVLEGSHVTGARVRSPRGFETTVSCRVLIDASGYRADLLKQAGVMNGHQRFGVGAEYDLYAPYFNQDEVVLMVGSAVAPCGYGWAFPWGKNRVRLGVGVIHADSNANPEEYLNRLLESGPAFGMNLQGAQPIEYHTGLIPSDGMCEKFVGDGIIGVGDSAGQPSALLGEGIRWAIHAGQMAGEITAEAIHARDCSQKFLNRYEKRWRARFGANLRLAHKINKRIAGWSDAQWDRGTELLKLLTPDQFAKALRTELLGLVAQAFLPVWFLKK
ncbi:MAG: NAD(P)/FAD-dependent oxidoreductase [Bryobacteraceae bacterium]